MQIESAEGVRNANEIASVEGVDSLMVGPTDLRFDMGLPGMYGTEPEFNEAIAAVDRAARANNIPIAGFAFGPAIKTRIEWGWSVLMVSSDLFALTAAESLTLTEAQLAADAATGKAVAVQGTKEQQRALAEGDAQATAQTA
jgi:2-keto-3-deoxy-L-rhamnonate aldolase RhmA